MMLPQVLDFSTKRVVWRIELKRLQQKYKNERFSFTVKRETTFQDSYSALGALSQKQWRGPMTVEFSGEDGIDEGGLFKEWLSNMSKEIFNEDMALFVKAHSGSTYYPNPKSVVQPDFVAMFCFVGRVFGKALWDFQLVDCYFVKAFYKLLLGMPLSYHDLEDYDSTLYNSLNWMVQNPGADLLCRDFVETVDYFGEQKEVELI
jgi:E3 ubiquitin-protein ligase HUWE1